MEHVHVGARSRPWLPTRSGLRPSLYCPECGAVRAMGVYPTRRLGYYTNILGQVRRSSAPRCLTVGQIRLIVKALEAHDAFEDAWQTPGEVQAHIFLHTVKHVAPGALATCEAGLSEGVRQVWRVVAPA